MSQFNGEQTRHVNAFNNLEFFFGENKDVFSKNVPVQKWVERLINNNKAIVALSTTKGTGSEGATEAKDNLKETIATNAGTVCSYAADYAVETGNTDLFSLVNYSSYDVIRLRDSEVLGFINGVVTAITPLVSLPDFKDYIVTAEDLSTLSKDANDFNNNLGKNKLIINNSHVASHDIDALIKNNRNVIIRLDKLIPNFKKDAPKFVAAYYKAKRIDDTGVRHSGIRGIIVNNTGTPVEGATVTLVGKKNTKGTTTGSDGSFEIVKFLFGKAKLTIAAPGFDSITTDVTITRGKIIECDCRLQSVIVEFKTA